MSTPSMTPSDEHQRAERKHAKWLREIDDWKADHQRALLTLSQAEEFIREHDALLDHHAESIREHEQKIREHEARLEQRAEGAEDQALHEELQQLHQRVLEQHNRFRGRHPALMSEITRLAVELHKVSHKPG